MNEPTLEEQALLLRMRVERMMEEYGEDEQIVVAEKNDERRRKLGFIVPEFPS